MKRLQYATAEPMSRIVVADSPRLHAAGKVSREATHGKLR